MADHTPQLEWRDDCACADDGNIMLLVFPDLLGGAGWSSEFRYCGLMLDVQVGAPSERDAQLAAEGSARDWARKIGAVFGDRVLTPPQMRLVGFALRFTSSQQLSRRSERRCRGLTRLLGQTKADHG